MTIALMGDTMLGRLVSEVIQRRDAGYVWGDTLPLLKACDLRILNLETTITTTGSKWSEWPKVFYYRAVPQAVEVLKAARIDYVNLANNHILDFSESGLRDTLAHLDQAGIQHTGAGFSLAEASAPIRLEARGLSVGIFSLSDHYVEWDAGQRGAGIFYVSIPPSSEQWQRIKSIIRRLKEQSDLVLLSVHWGPNMRDVPSRKVVDLAHRLASEGVDIVHGHSAHVFHGVEVFQGKVILYDTGEFIDDYAVDPLMRNDFSFLYLVHVAGKSIQQVELIPVRIASMQVNVAKGADRKQIFELFEQRTRPFDTKYAIKNDRIVIPVMP